MELFIVTASCVKGFSMSFKNRKKVCKSYNTAISHEKEVILNILHVKISIFLSYHKSVVVVILGIDLFFDFNF